MPAPLAALTAAYPPELVPAFPGRLVVPVAARAYVVAGIAAHSPGPVLAVVPGEREAEDLADDLELFADDVVLFPAWETLPFEHVSPNVATMAHRAEARHRLDAGTAGAVIVASVRALTQRVSPSPARPLVLEAATEAGFDATIQQLASLGYHRTERVEARGEFAVRGGIVDLYPAQGHQPARVEFWGDDIEEIRLFSVSSQRAVAAVARVVAYPARELRPDDEVRKAADRLCDEEPWAAEAFDRIGAGILFPGLESWLPWLAPERGPLQSADPSTRIVVFDEARGVARSRDLVAEEMALAEALAPTWGPGAPDAGAHPALYLPLDEVLAEGRGPERLTAPPVPSGPADDAVTVRALGAAPGDPESVAGAIATWQGRGVGVVVAMDGEPAAQRVAGLLSVHGLAVPVLEAVDAARPAVVARGIHEGFVLPAAGVGVVGEREVAGRRRAHRRVRPGPRPGAEPVYRDLAPGDFVVHHHHGIGRFEGLVHRAMAGVERDYLLIAYHGADRLYVPTDQLGGVRKYTGGEAPRLSRLGGSDWATIRGKVRKEVAVVAEAVVDLHRRRAGAAGVAFEPDTPWQAEFEAAFPFEETPDQLTAIADVKRDMERPQPMDRLIFGDVGFGKTEIAIRAAFKAVQSGTQVAMLVPTTLLAQQHHTNLEDRFRPYPVRVEMLSRFLTAGQQRRVLDGLARGEVDIVIGTHRLLSEDVAFANLGLLVVDEEQRFGVTAKDRLKELRESLDVLTLTATPIPRTLEMALVGIREVSHIQTPPEDRHPILTYVGPYDEQAVSAAVRRELLREGQVYYVHNRIASIDLAVERLRRLVPDARYAMAHGRMSEGQLEQVMFDFWNGEYDVLVATTIIESGLDLPQVNTLLVERADLLGLAQLYQLRGRVGRSDQRAYAYLFHPPEESLTEDAYRRLEAVGEFTDLGSGFELAMRDLQIRGAGSILSEVQSGHIAAVGFDLYCELVADAVDELRGIAPTREAPAEVRIDLPVDAHLPADYIPGADARLEAYRKLAAATTPSEVEDVGAEWVDRYGPWPESAAALLDVARLRVEALRIGLTELVKLRDEIRLAPVALRPAQEVRLERIARGAVLRSSVLFIPAPRPPMVAALLDFLRTMWPPAEE